ncbi:MAG: hypothetical protein DMF71_13360, partial [Acidobacteria bacterium]
IDVYYGHRLQLFKDGRLIPYREEATKLIESKDTSSRLVDVVSDFFIEPKTTRTEGLRLKDWYGPLPPGRTDYSTAAALRSTAPGLPILPSFGSRSVLASNIP